MTPEVYICIKFKKTVMENNPHIQNSAQRGKLVIGGLLIFAGTLLMLSNLDIFGLNMAGYLFSWKSILIYIGLFLLATRPNKQAAYILIGLGVFFWLPDIFGYPVRLRDVFWPLVFIGFGFLLIYRQRPHPGIRYDENGNPVKDHSGYLNDVSLFGGGIKIIQSKNFKGGSVTAVMGGSEFDLRQVEFATNVAVIDVFTLFGGTKFIVPENWTVHSDAVSILGGFTDKRMVGPVTSEDHILVIKGLVMLGGIEIKSF
jgi:predicted membrane protein